MKDNMATAVNTRQKAFEGRNRNNNMMRKPEWKGFGQPNWRRCPLLVPSKSGPDGWLVLACPEQVKLYRPDKLCAGKLNPPWYRLTGNL